MARPIGKTFVEIDLDAKKYEKGVVDIKTTTKKKLSEIEKAWKGMGKKSEATIDQMKAKINKDYDTIKKHSLSTADDIVRAEKAKNAKIARINKQQFGEQKSWIDKAKKHWMAFSAVVIAAIYAIQRTFVKALSMYADWEVALKRLGNVSDETIPEMRKKILNISPALGSVTELTKGYYQVLSAGVKEPLAAMDLLTTSAKMSKEATIEQADAVKGLAALMGIYSTELTTANDAADLLYKTEALGITTVGELTPLIGNLATQAEAVGLKADEMATALAQITTTGAGTAISVTQLQSLLTALSKKFALLPPEVKKYGSATAAVKALGFQGVLKEIMDATGGNSTALIKMLGRQEAYLALLQLSKNEFGEYSKKLEEMTDKAGSFDDAWQRYSVTLTALWETFKNTIGKQAILIAEKLTPAIKEVLKVMNKWLGLDFVTQQKKNRAEAEKMIETLKELKENADVAFIGPGIAESAKQIQERAKEMTKYVADLNERIKEQQRIIDKSTEAIKNWGKEATKKGPEKQIDKTTDAIVETASALEISGSSWDDYTRNIVNSSKESYAAWKEAMEDIAIETASELDLSSSYWDDYTRHVVDIANTSYNAWKKSLKDTANKAGKTAGEMIGSFADVVASVADTAKSVASKVSSFISDIWSGLKTAIGMVGGVITFFITFPKNLKDALEGFAESIMDLPGIVKEFFAAADIFFENLPDIVTTFIDSVGEFIDGIIEALPRVVDSIIAEIPRLVDTFVEELPRIMDALIEGAEEFTWAIVEEIPRIIEAIMAEIPDMITSFMEVFLPAILDMIPDVIEKILQGLPDIIKAFSAAMPTVVTALMDAIADLIPILIEEIPLIVEALTDAMVADSPRIIDAIIEGIPLIVEALVEAIIEHFKGKTVETLFDPAGRYSGTTIQTFFDPAGIFWHTGGVIGQESQTSRSAPASIFAGASHAHKGLMTDEVPIIAKRGEGVFTPAQMQALGGGYGDRGVTINSPLVNIGGNLIADKQVFNDFVEDIEYALDKRSRRVYA